MSDNVIPIYIIAYNNLTFVQSFVQQCIKLTPLIVIVDNCSTYPALHTYYDFLESVLKEKVLIHRLQHNYGHTVYLVRPDLFPDVYVLSDPDLLLNKDMPLDCCQRLAALSIEHQAYKVGLALDLSDRDNFVKGSGAISIYNMEIRYWQQKIPSSEYELYNAPIDTTFTLVNRNIKNMQCIRVAGCFTCKHLPWCEGYLQNNVPLAELQHWTKNNISSSILQHVEPTKPLNQSIQLLSAMYGVEKKVIDVTKKLQGHCTENEIQITKHADLAELLGDPAPGQQKKLFLTIKRGSIIAKFELPEANRHLVETFKYGI